MKKLMILLASVMSLLMFTAIGARAEGMLLEYDGTVHEYDGAVYSLVVNNQILNPPLSPIIFNDRALVPVREIFEEVGATVDYEGKTQTVHVSGYNTDVKMKINDNVAYVNGDKINIPDNVVPKLISKVGGETKTMVPVRFISESIGLDVDFNNEAGAILIESDDYTPSDYQVTPYESKSLIHITDVEYDGNGANGTVAVITDGAIGDISDFRLSNPDRIVLDIKDAALGGVPNTVNVNMSGIKSIRFGDSEDSARVVIDVEDLSIYSVHRVSDNKIEIYTKVSNYQPSKQVKPDVSSPAQSIYDMLVVLDAGHGGADSGAVGYLNGNMVLEKNLTLEITNRVKNILEGAGYKVSMTRTGDTLPTLQERPAQANAENAAVFVSIHINSVDNAPSANGTEVYYAESNNGNSYGATSSQLAANILERMLYYMHSTNRGVKTAEHAVTKRSNMPAALAEVGFITNPEEVYLMTTDDYQQKAAQGIAEGIILTLREISMPR